MALPINALMFVVEIVGGLRSGSASLFADAVDFAGDAASYGLSLGVPSTDCLWRARGARVKGLTMGAYGFLVLGRIAWAVASGGALELVTMPLRGRPRVRVKRRERLPQRVFVVAGFIRPKKGPSLAGGDAEGTFESA